MVAEDFAVQHPGKAGLHLFLCLDLPLGPASLKDDIAWEESKVLVGGSSSPRGATVCFSVEQQPQCSVLSTDSISPQCVAYPRFLWFL